MPRMGEGRGVLAGWRQCATRSTSRLRKAGDAASKRVSESIQRGLTATTSVAGDAYTAALNWKDNGEFSRWLTANLSNQRANIATKAMDAEYIRTHIGGNWHRLYDGSHTLIGSWQAVREALPDIGAIDRLG